MEEEATQPATQLVIDPRRLGHHNSGLNDEDLTDIICILHPASRPACHATVILAHDFPQHLVRNNADDEEPSMVGGAAAAMAAAVNNNFLAQPQQPSRDIALRLSAKLQNPLVGYQFGRNQLRCDIYIGLNGNAAKRVSNVHFRIYLNEYGTIMLEDLSTNGTQVDDIMLHAREKENGADFRHTLENGTVITLIMTPPDEDVRFIVRIPQRDIEHEEEYTKNVTKWFLRMKNLETPRIGQNKDKPGGPPNLFPKALDYNQSLNGSRHLREWKGGSKYNRVGKIGKGAFATVYKVTQKYDGKPFAAKELDKRRFMKNGILDQKVETEMTIMSKIKHPNIVQFIEHVDWEDYLYIIMDYIPNGDLGDLVSENRRLPEIMVRSMAAQLLDVLKYLHKLGITHRDIKPDNILIQSLDPIHIKLTDFGLSKMVEDQDTFLRTFCGTLLYCAPEVYSEYREYDHLGQRTHRAHDKKKLPPQRYDQAVDLWSLAGVLFFALTGHPPYMARGGTTYQELLHNIMTKALDVRPLQRCSISEAGIQFIKSMLHVRPEERATIEELQNSAWIQGDTVDSIMEDEDNAEGDDEGDDEVDLIRGGGDSQPQDEGEGLLEVGASQLSLHDEQQQQQHQRYGATAAYYDHNADRTYAPLSDVTEIQQPRVPGSFSTGDGSTSLDSFLYLQDGEPHAGNKAARLFGEVNASVLGSSGAIAPDNLNLPLSQHAGEGSLNDRQPSIESKQQPSMENNNNNNNYNGIGNIGVGGGDGNNDNNGDDDVARTTGVIHYPLLLPSFGSSSDGVPGRGGRGDGHVDGPNPTGIATGATARRPGGGGGPFTNAPSLLGAESMVGQMQVSSPRKAAGITSPGFAVPSMSSVATSLDQEYNDSNNKYTYDTSVSLPPLGPMTAGAVNGHGAAAATGTNKANNNSILPTGSLRRPRPEDSDSASSSGNSGNSGSGSGSGSGGSPGQHEQRRHAKKRFRSARAIEMPVSKSIFWNERDKATWHADYPSITLGEYQALEELARRRGEHFAHGGDVFEKVIASHKACGGAEAEAEAEANVGGAGILGPGLGLGLGLSLGHGVGTSEGLPSRDDNNGDGDGVGGGGGGGEVGQPARARSEPLQAVKRTIEAKDYGDEAAAAAAAAHHRGAALGELSSSATVRGYDQLLPLPTPSLPQQQQIDVGAVGAVSPEEKVTTPPPLPHLITSVDAGAGAGVPTMLRREHAILSDNTVAAAAAAGVGLGNGVVGNNSSVVARLVCTPESVVRRAPLPVASALTSWGRSPLNTVVHGDARETRVPKHAFKLLWCDAEAAADAGAARTAAAADSPDQQRPEDGPRRGRGFFVSTKSSQGIVLNGMKLRSSESRDARAPSRHWARLAHGDVVQVWDNTRQSIGFVFEIEKGGDAMTPDASGAATGPASNDAVVKEEMDKNKKRDVAMVGEETARRLDELCAVLEADFWAKRDSLREREESAGAPMGAAATAPVMDQTTDDAVASTMAISERSVGLKAT